MHDALAPEQNRTDPVRIVLIEDDELCAQIVAASLSHIRWASPRIDIAGSLREALARLTLEKFDLVIADLGLPDSNGLATLDAVATAFDRLIIVYTSNNDSSLRDRAIARGAYDLLRKGTVDVTALERVLRVATLQSGTMRSLRDTEARYRKTFELAGSGIAHVDLDGHLLRVNRKLCEILGYPEGELVGRSVRELSHPEDRDGEPEAVRTEKRFLRKDGGIVWVEVTVAPVHDAAGQPQYEISVIEDITERKRAEAHQAAHTRYQEAIARFGQSALAKRDPAELVEEAVHTVERGLDAYGVCYVDAAHAPGANDPVATVLYSGVQYLGGGQAVVAVGGGERVGGPVAAHSHNMSALGRPYLHTAATLLS